MTLILVRHGQSQWNLENRFTGWTDVDLSPLGHRQAVLAGRILKAHGFEVQQSFTSVLVRAIHTLWKVLDEMCMSYVPERKSWRLNERHYGALQGLNKKETAELHGAEKVHLWRRSYAIPPPALDLSDPRHPSSDPRYSGMDPKDLPCTESLKDTITRCLPLWHAEIAPALTAGQNVLIAAHGNSLRGIVKHLDDLSDEGVVGLEIPTGVPLIYELGGGEASQDAEDIQRSPEGIQHPSPTYKSTSTIKPIRHFYLAEHLIEAPLSIAVIDLLELEEKLPGYLPDSDRESVSEKEGGAAKGGGADCSKRRSRLMGTLVQLLNRAAITFPETLHHLQSHVPMTGSSLKSETGSRVILTPAGDTPNHLLPMTTKDPKDLSPASDLDSTSGSSTKKSKLDSTLLTSNFVWIQISAASFRDDAISESNPNAIHRLQTPSRKRELETMDLTLIKGLVDNYLDPERNTLVVIADDLTPLSLGRERFDDDEEHMVRRLSRLGERLSAHLGGGQRMLLVGGFESRLEALGQIAPSSLASASGGVTLTNDAQGSEKTRKITHTNEPEEHKGKEEVEEVGKLKSQMTDEKTTPQIKRIQHDIPLVVVPMGGAAAAAATAAGGYTVLGDDAKARDITASLIADAISCMALEKCSIRASVPII